MARAILRKLGRGIACTRPVASTAKTQRRAAK
jgi:hypothetical protein